MTSSVTPVSVTSQFRDLTPTECLDLLGSVRLGRVAYDDDGPVVLPVNYVVDRGTLLFRTSPYGKLGRHMQGSQVAFEVDQIDESTGAGWSVLVRGRAGYVDPLDLPETGARPASWREPEGLQSLHVRITPTSVSGRRHERLTQVDPSLHPIPSQHSSASQSGVTA